MTTSKFEISDKVNAMIDDLRRKIEQSVPETGFFPLVYSDFRVADSSLCLTDLMLTFRPKPPHLPECGTKRWLELVGYKLPAPYKSTTIIFTGTKAQALDYLTHPDTPAKILTLIPRLNSNLLDI